MDEPEPFGGNIDTLLHPRQLPTLGRIERLIGCCQGKFSKHLRAGEFLQTPEPCVGKIDTLLHHHYLPTLRRIEELIGCCQGSFCFSPCTFPGYQLQLLAKEKTQDIPWIVHQHHL